MSKRDDGPENANRIVAYIHCAMCLDEWKDPANRASDDTTPAQWARLNAGWTKRGFQLWCVRHDVNVLHVDFEGAKHKANTTAKKPGTDA